MDAVKSFSNVQKLSLKELYKLCKTLGVCKTFPRNVKVNAVCHCLGLSTAGGSVGSWTPLFEGADRTQVAELEALSPRGFYG